ncbi:MAG: hypothetical protein AAFV53_34410 [Myxococcota bacterium]
MKHYAPIVPSMIHPGLSAWDDPERNPFAVPEYYISTPPSGVPGYQETLHELARLDGALEMADYVLDQQMVGVDFSVESTALLISTLNDFDGDQMQDRLQAAIDLKLSDDDQSRADRLGLRRYLAFMADGTLDGWLEEIPGAIADLESAMP